MIICSHNHLKKRYYNVYIIQQRVAKVCIIKKSFFNIIFRESQTLN